MKQLETIVETLLPIVELARNPHETFFTKDEAIRVEHTYHRVNTLLSRYRIDQIERKLLNNEIDLNTFIMLYENILLVKNHHAIT